MKSKFGIGIERILLNEKEIEKEREMKSSTSLNRNLNSN